MILSRTLSVSAYAGKSPLRLALHETSKPAASPLQESDCLEPLPMPAEGNVDLFSLKKPDPNPFCPTPLPYVERLKKAVPVVASMAGLLTLGAAELALVANMPANAGPVRGLIIPLALDVMRVGHSLFASSGSFLCLVTGFENMRDIGIIFERKDGFKQPILETTVEFTAEELQQKWQSLNWSDLLADHRAVLLGERHHCDLGHYQSLLWNLVELKKRGLTHLTVEVPNKFHLLVYGVSDPARFEVLLMAKLLGIQIEAVDEGRLSLPDLTIRNQCMAERIAKILEQNPQNKVLHIGGAHHITERFTYSISLSTLLQDCLARFDISALSFVVVNANKAEQESWYPTNREIRAAGLQNEEFVMVNQHPNSDFTGMINLPESPFVPSWIKSFFKAPAWLKAIAYRIQNGSGYFQEQK
jgi:hypothetical protein